MFPLSPSSYIFQVVQVVTIVVATLATHNGMMIHIYYLTPEQVANTIKWLKGIEIGCIICPMLIKLSICVSILRLVTDAQRTITIAIWFLMLVLSLTGTATFLVEAVQCMPLKKLWEPEVPGKCIKAEIVNWILAAYGSKCTHLLWTAQAE